MINFQQYSLNLVLLFRVLHASIQNIWNNLTELVWIEVHSEGFIKLLSVDRLAGYISKIGQVIYIYIYIVDNIIQNDSFVLIL